MKYVLLFLFLGFFNAQAQSYLDYYFKANNINGAIVIYNENKDEWLFSTELEPFSNTPAAAHFHLWQALVGLEEKVFKIDVKEKLMWDGVKRSFFDERKPEWNADTNLIDAIKNKNDWYFDRLQNYLPQESYSSNIKKSTFFKEIKNNELQYFWNYAALTNPNSMILFLKELKEGKLPFNKQSQQFVYNQLLKDEKLAIHTATTNYLGKRIDWTVGVYLKQSKPIYFSLRTYTSLETTELDDYERRKNLIISQIFDVLNY